MIWSLQLTPWALGSLLAVLLVVRDLEYLWVRRREPSVRALASLAAVTGLWALLHLLTVLSPTLAFVPVFLRVEDVAAALAPVAWLWFGLSYAGRGRDLKRRPLWIVYVVTAVTVAFALRPGQTWLTGGTDLVVQGGFVGLRVHRGAWYVVQLVVAAGAVITATAVLVRHLGRRAGARRRVLVALGAGLVGVGAIATHMVWSPAADWRDLTPAAFGVASAFLGWGLLRQRLLTLGPVARTLVMVELQDPIVVIDGKGRIVDGNRAAERVLGLRPYGDVPVPLGTLWARSRRESVTSSHLRLEAVEEGGPRTFEVTVTSLDRRGAPGRSVIVLRDVTPLLEAHAEMEKLANTDALTTLANRRHFMDALAAEIERAKRYERPLSLVQLDLDRFKSVNDTHGHAAGDDALRAAAATLRSVCRDVDVAARIGGEELALLLPETTASGARTVAERVRRKIEQVVLTSPAGVTFHITASFGISALSEERGTPDGLLQAADDALYRAKESGRNRVVVGR